MCWHEDLALAPCIRGHLCPPLQGHAHKRCKFRSKEAWENAYANAYAYDNTVTLMSN